MRLSWPQHLQTARLLESASQAQCGMALGLMGVSLLILAEDLLAAELAPRSHEKTR
jgi:phosphoribosylaminoimidazole carboxylase (NCAIR synthetase)